MSSKHPRPIKPASPAVPEGDSVDGRATQWRTAEDYQRRRLTMEFRAEERVYPAGMWPADEMKVLGEVDPSLPSRVTSMAEKEQDWRHARVDRVDKWQAQIQFMRIGHQLLGTLAGASLLVGMVILAYMAMERGHLWLAGGFITAPFYVTVRLLLRAGQADPPGASKKPKR